MKLRRIALSACLLACLGTCMGAPAVPRGDPGPSPDAPRRKLLLFTLTQGFHHDSTEVLERELPKLGKESGAFEVTVTKAPGDFTDEKLKPYDAVFFFTTGNVLPEPSQRKALIDFVGSGKGFIGAHNATDSLYDFPEYGDMLGGYFDGHPWNQVVTVKVEDRTHPATKDLEASFKFKEEIYQYKDFSRDKVHVLMSLDNSSVNIGRGKRADKDYAVSWVREYGKGRVFFTGLGHYGPCWKDETIMKKHLLPGIRWAMGDVMWERPATR